MAIAADREDLQIWKKKTFSWWFETINIPSLTREGNF